jgi:hypothetical protein
MGEWQERARETLAEATVGRHLRRKRWCPGHTIIHQPASPSTVLASDSVAASQSHSTLPHTLSKVVAADAHQLLPCSSRTRTCDYITDVLLLGCTTNPSRPKPLAFTTINHLSQANNLSSDDFYPQLVFVCCFQIFQIASCFCVVPTC